MLPPDDPSNAITQFQPQSALNASTLLNSNPSCLFIFTLFNSDTSCPFISILAWLWRLSLCFTVRFTPVSSISQSAIASGDSVRFPRSPNSSSFTLLDKAFNPLSQSVYSQSPPFLFTCRWPSVVLYSFSGVARSARDSEAFQLFLPSLRAVDWSRSSCCSRCPKLTSRPPTSNSFRSSAVVLTVNFSLQVSIKHYEICRPYIVPKTWNCAISAHPSFLAPVRNSNPGWFLDHITLMTWVLFVRYLNIATL